MNPPTSTTTPAVEHVNHGQLVDAWIKGHKGAVVAMILVVIGVLAVVLSVAVGSSSGSGSGGTSTPSAAVIASSIVGSAVTSGACNGGVVQSAVPAGVVSTDAAGDASVPVMITINSDCYEPVSGQEANVGNSFSGTVTLYANGSSVFTYNTP